MRRSPKGVARHGQPLANRRLNRSSPATCNCRSFQGISTSGCVGLSSSGAP